MKDTLVSFEVAKLAKEKGFNWKCRDFYPDLSWNSKEEYHKIDVGGEEFNVDTLGFGDIIERPTQSLLQRWLREVHNVHIEVNYSFEVDRFMVVIHNKKNARIEKEIELLSLYTEDYLKYATYEEALEIGLLEGLKLIEL